MSKMKGDDGGDCMCTHACVRVCVCVCVLFFYRGAPAGTEENSPTTGGGDESGGGAQIMALIVATLQ